MSIQKAKEFAELKHKGQKYADRDYFETHVQGVANSVNQTLARSEEVSNSRFQLLLTIAYLHDTVEDSDATIEEIEGLFGSEVAEAIDALTHREGEEYQEYVKRAIKNKNSRVVKYHDIMFNLKHSVLLESLDDNKTKRRCKKYTTALMSFGGVL